VFGTILSRMIFWSLVKVFLLCLVAITGILLMAGIVAEASQQGLGPGQILAIIPLLIPSTLPYTIPATTLFATCVVYGRMAADNEILAIRSSGVNLVRVVGPALLLGVLVSAGTMGLYYRIIPYTHHLMRTMFLADVEDLLYAMLKKNGQLSHPGFDYSMFVRSVQGRRLLGPVFKHHDFYGDTDSSATAEEAELHVDMPTKTLLVRMRFGVAWSKPDTHAYFDQRDWTIDLPPDLVKNHNRRPRDMTWEELDGELERLGQKLEENARYVEWAEELAEKKGLAGVRIDMPQHVKNLKKKGDQYRRQVLDVITEQHMRPALSLGCLFFVLVGCPVGIWFGRSDYLSSFISCFLPIIFIYYPLMLCGTGMAKDGKFDTMLTVWAADIVVGAVGVAFLGRLVRN
jgi:lipopolysaccharide export system permease protein